MFPLFLVLAAGAPSVIEPDWASKPTAEQVGHAYPRAASLLGVEGRAVVACQVDWLGVLKDCEAPFESPNGFGFGKAGLQLTPYFRMRPRVVDGRPVDGGDVRIPINFKLPTPPIPPEPPRPVAAVTPESLDLARKILKAELYDMRIRARLATFPSMAIAAPGLAESRRKAAFEAVWTYAQAAADPWLEGAARAMAGQSDPGPLRARLTMAEIARPPEKLQGVEIPPLSPALRNARHMQRTAQAAFCAARACKFDPVRLARASADEAVAPQLRNPAWLEKPTPQQLYAARPLIGRLFNLPGAVALRCRALGTGALADCQVRLETPARLGFGPAALDLVPYYRISPALLSQGAAGEAVSLVIGFGAPPDEKQGLPKAVTDHEKHTLEYLRLVTLEAEAPEGLAQLLAMVRADPMAGVDEATRAAVEEALENSAESETGDFEEARAVELAKVFTEDQIRRLTEVARSADGRQAILDGPRIQKALLAFEAEKAREIQAVARTTVCKEQSCVSDPFPKAPEAKP